MAETGDRPVAIIGAGPVGMGWDIVFARAGRKVQVHDASANLLFVLPGRLGALYRDIAAERSEHAPWSAGLIACADAERRASLPLDKLADRCVWRDQRLMAFAAHKKTQPELHFRSFR